jgi:hypothetical protein
VVEEEEALFHGPSDVVDVVDVDLSDDPVILCQRGKAEETLRRMRGIMGKLKLTVSEEKTRICKVPEGELDFLARDAPPGSPGVFTAVA